MKSFKLFFGLALAAMLLFFVAKVVFIAFVAATVMSIIYAIYRRIKDFVTYDRYGAPYFPNHYNFVTDLEVEPLFYDQRQPRQMARDIHFIEAM